MSIAQEKVYEELCNLKNNKIEENGTEIRKLLTYIFG